MVGIVATAVAIKDGNEKADEILEKVPKAQPAGTLDIFSDITGGNPEGAGERLKENVQQRNEAMEKIVQGIGELGESATKQIYGNFGTDVVEGVESAVEMIDEMVSEDEPETKADEGC